MSKVSLSMSKGTPDNVFVNILRLHAERRKNMNFQLHFTVQNLLAIVAGIAILIRPRLLNYIVAIYLIVTGVIGILGLKV